MPIYRLTLRRAENDSNRVTHLVHSFQHNKYGRHTHVIHDRRHINFDFELGDEKHLPEFRDFIGRKAKDLRYDIEASPDYPDAASFYAPKE
ncbi:MAG: hypothetical protein QT00_C0001G0404 [archaeon GW2011_AR5]|nr:MAG: hypothetical protein QT00_C0001G0404 [archaeon GW2011_AR5]